MESTKILNFNLNGIYWSEDGQDPRSLCSFNPKNVTLNENNEYELRIVNTRDDTPFLYSGAMIRTSELIDLSKEETFVFECQLPTTNFTTASLWPKSIAAGSDINEVDFFEIYNVKKFKIFGVLFQKITLTMHYGTSYANDHTFKAKSAWVKNGKLKLTFKTGKKLKWYINNKLKFKVDNTITFPCTVIASCGIEGGVSYFNYDKFIFRQI